MAHFAKVHNGIVMDVHVVSNDAIVDSKGKESEALGQAFLVDLWGGMPADYVQCSYNGSIRGCYPGIGYAWDGSVFTAPIAPEVSP